VHHHDVAGRDARTRDLQVLGGDVLELRAFRVAERSAVAEVAVKTSVDPLREPEECRVGIEDQPSNIDALVDQVPEARSKELGDATARRGGVDLPEPMSAQTLAPASELVVVAPPTRLVEHAVEARGVATGDRDLVDAITSPLPSDRSAALPGFILLESGLVG